MYEASFLVRFAAAACLHAARLEIPDVGAGRDLTIGILRRHPHFQIVGFACAEAHITRAQSHFTIRQTQQLQHFLSVAGHLFQRRHGIFRTYNLHHLDFVELVHTYQTAGIAAVRSGFRAEARRMRGHFDRQIVFINDFIANQVGQRNFRRRDQRVVAAVGFFFQRTGMEQVAGEFRQLTGTV